ncbi:MAG: 16S rRNA (guanine(527)-N(7))-methyltransferase RsmG [Deferribacteraceae bacterium]|jgi:16S rRNA (guanine527-N7)-methyltransferase|nr:16S rRNA (guanine(527)-N(7))-methyltransferase RsmG [Deferribacteraceae bacterium]
MIQEFIQVSEREHSAFEQLYELMVASPVNVTAIKSKDDYYIKHVLDSVYVFKAGLIPELDINSVSTVADIGSGGGFPGIILAICYPHLQITLVESITKKCRYLENVVGSLALSNVVIKNARAEAISESFDLATARGVGTIKEVYNYTQQLVKKGWLMYKGEKLNQEQEEFKLYTSKRRLKSAVKRIETPFTRSYLYLHY